MLIDDTCSLPSIYPVTLTVNGSEKYIWPTDGLTKPQVIRHRNNPTNNTWTYTGSGNPNQAIQTQTQHRVL
ncbi:hypothetical protein [Tropheryma whipplei]|uniref:hypothetical protein n=1 Tax=Tropheryma whipplei TaxID=2039 RepID=UPI0002DDFC11|nr:hypothetical protein [Tropheryma whipplei]